ncbi:hypothetical protein [Paractinoplanes toevensis]|uniref:Uncharacterized protein n=1 Tax=Paractinoplanes toevensis TaxID=571911 RepID=A0A919W768_9ACTN|nr:hypothetical protein [Actinoplanes toevensis]GIM94353.1 hypothetical protein Ato02nite_061460 [Actinoplanes toevensis]
MTTGTSGRDDIVARAKSDFAFLEQAAARPAEVEDDAWRTVLAYTLGTITIEVELDWRERISKLENRFDELFPD